MEPTESLNRHNLESLWQRVEDARREWKSARNHVSEVQADTVGMPSADGSYVRLRALHDQRLAVENYCHALQDFNAALVAERTSQEEPAPANGHEPLTPREGQVLKLIAAGNSSKQIATQLGIAFRTVVCHRYRLYHKLNVHTNVELTRAALRMGLVEL